MKGKESNPLNIDQTGIGRVGKLLVWATLGVPGGLSLEETIRKAVNDGVGVIVLMNAAENISKNLPSAFLLIGVYTLTRLLNWYLKEELTQISDGSKKS